MSVATHTGRMARAIRGVSRPLGFLAATEYGGGTTSSQASRSAMTDTGDNGVLILADLGYRDRSGSGTPSAAAPVRGQKLVRDLRTERRERYDLALDRYETTDAAGTHFL